MESVGVMAPFASVPLHAVAPPARAQSHQSTALNGKAMAWSPGSRSRAMASSMASDGVQEPSSSSSSHGQNVPKSDPFNQSRISRLLREPSLLEKAEHALAGMKSLNPQIYMHRDFESKLRQTEPILHRMNKIPCDGEVSQTSCQRLSCDVFDTVPACSMKFGSAFVQRNHLTGVAVTLFCGQRGVRIWKAMRHFVAGKRCLSLRTSRCSFIHSCSPVAFMISVNCQSTAGCVISHCFCKYLGLINLKSVICLLGPEANNRGGARDVQEAYQVECDAASGDERASACRPLERFQNLVRQSGLYLNTVSVGACAKILLRLFFLFVGRSLLAS